MSRDLTKDLAGLGITDGSSKGRDLDADLAGLGLGTPAYPEGTSIEDFMPAVERSPLLAGVEYMQPQSGGISVDTPVGLRSRAVPYFPATRPPSTDIGDAFADQLMPAMRQESKRAGEDYITRLAAGSMPNQPPVQPADATQVAQLQMPRSTELGANLSRQKEAGYSVRPDLTSIENPAFYDQSSADQRKAREMYFWRGLEAVQAAGLEPPEFPYGNIAGAARAFGGAITGRHHETQGASPLVTGAAGLVGEGVKYASLMRGGAALGLKPLASELAAAGVSGAMREGGSKLENIATEVGTVAAGSGLLRALGVGLRNGVPNVAEAVEPSVKPTIEPKATEVTKPSTVSLPEMTAADKLPIRQPKTKKVVTPKVKAKIGETPAKRKQSWEMTKEEVGINVLKRDFGFSDTEATTILRAKDPIPDIKKALRKRGIDVDRIDLPAEPGMAGIDDMKRPSGINGLKPSHEESINLAITEVENAIVDIKQTLLPEHMKIVREAITAGKSVPAKVLKDYPDLLPPSKAKKVITPKPKPKTKKVVTPKAVPPKVETPKQAVQEIVEGKRESKIGIKEFKKRMIAELDRVALDENTTPSGINRVSEMLDWIKKEGLTGFKARTANEITIRIPGDGEFKLAAGADIGDVYKRVRRLSETSKPSATYKVDGKTRRSMGPEQNWMIRTSRGQPQVGPSAKSLKEGLADGTVEFVPKSKSSTTLGFMGANPEVAAQLGKNVLDAAKSISESTSAMVKEIKVKPEIKSAVEAFKNVATEHDRGIRSAEFMAAKLKKIIKEAIPDTKRQMLMTKALEDNLQGKHWNQLTELEKAMTRWLGTELDKLDTFVADNKIVNMLKRTKTFRHIKHAWINPESLEPYSYFYGKFSKTAVGGRIRKIRTIEQGEKFGLTHAITNPGELIGLQWIDMMRAHQARQTLKSLFSIPAEKGATIVLRKGGKPRPIRVLERWDLLKKQGLTDGYVRYASPILDKSIVFKVDGKLMVLKGAVGVKKELYPFVRAYLESPKYGTLAKLNFASKTLKLTASLFHPMMLGAQELAHFRVPFKNIPRGLRIREKLGPELKLLYEEGGEFLKGGYEDLGYNNQFFEGSTTAGKVGNSITKPVSLMRDFTFDIVQPGMKISYAYDLLHKMMPRYLKGTNWTPDMVWDAIAKGKPIPKQARIAARKVVQNADGHFSGEHWKRSLLETNAFMAKMYFSPEARKFWQAALLSPTWQREHLLVAKNIAKSFMPDKMIKKLGMAELGPIKSQYRLYALGAISMIGSVDLWNLMSTQIMDGKARHIWENPEGKGFAVRAWWDEPSYKVTDKNGKVRTVQGGPAYIRPLKSVFEVAEWANDPFKKFAYKLSPAMTAIGRQLFQSRYQKEYKGIEDMPRRVRDFVLDVSTPIMFDQIVDMAQGKKTPIAGLLPFLGFPTSKVKDKSMSAEISVIEDLMLAGKSREAVRRWNQWNKRHPDDPITWGENGHINTKKLKRRMKTKAMSKAKAAR